MTSAREEKQKHEERGRGEEKEKHREIGKKREMYVKDKCLST